MIERGTLQSGDRVLEKNPLDQISRDRWAEAVGAVLARSYAPTLLHTIVDAGEDEFIRVARGPLNGHGFSQANYKRIFAILKRTAALNPLDGPAHVEEL